MGRKENTSVSDDLSARWKTSQSMFCLCESVSMPQSGRVRYDFIAQARATLEKRKKEKQHDLGLEHIIFDVPLIPRDYNE